MISEVVFTVEHGETTDAFVAFIASIVPSHIPGAEVISYTIAVDVDADSL